MPDKFIDLINKNHKIIILRHKDPDLDAYGSQYGLFYALKANFPEKEIYAVGDTNGLNRFREMDQIDPELYQESLVIIVDTCVRQMMEGDLYDQAKGLIIIDHHQNDPDIRHDLYIRNTNASSCAEIVVELLLEHDLTIPNDSAIALYSGIVADTGRFLHRNVSAATFEAAAKLIALGIDIQPIYAKMYSEPLKTKRLKSIFFATVEYSKNNVAFRKNDLNFLKANQIDTMSVSRGMVNQMSGIDEVQIWANFTFEEKTGRILCELRSKAIPILDVAKKYGGGGHLQACGCTVDTWEETDSIIYDLDQLLEEK